MKNGHMVYHLNMESKRRGIINNLARAKGINTHKCEGIFGMQSPQNKFTSIIFKIFNNTATHSNIQDRRALVSWSPMFIIAMH